MQRNRAGHFKDTPKTTSHVKIVHCQLRFEEQKNILKRDLSMIYNVFKVHKLLFLLLIGRTYGLNEPGCNG